VQGVKVKKAKQWDSPTVRAIRSEMERQGLTAYALAQLSGIPAATISRIFSRCRPDPQISTLERLADALKKSLEIR
jgi:transcriptional regulator with XRE-family HTH domain